MSTDDVWLLGIALAAGILLGGGVAIAVAWADITLHRLLAKKWRAEADDQRAKRRVERVSPPSLRVPRAPEPARHHPEFDILAFDPPPARRYPVGRDDTQPMTRVDGAT